MRLRGYSRLLACCLVGLLLGACDEAGDPAPNMYYTEASRSEREQIHVLRLVGTPYEMGLQHGELMAAELVEGMEWFDSDPMFFALMTLARDYGMIDEALAQSYPDLVDECRGMVEAAQAAGVAGLTLDKCVTLSYADVIVEYIEGLAGACTQIAAGNAATPDGTLIHARNMDNSYMRYLAEHPTIIVRRPEGQIPFLEVGFPGSVSPHSGMNAEGVCIASNENSSEDHDRVGRSHIQMSRQVLQQCASLDEAEAFLSAQDHCSAESLMVSDGDGRTAAVFEMTASHIGVRRMDEHGLVFLTNHFVHPEMVALHAERAADASTRSRLARLEQLLPPGGAASLHGTLDVATAITVLRDSHNPLTGETHPPDLFDGGGTIANNAAVHSMVFVPERRVAYVAMGEPHVPQHEFLGFDLEALLRGEAGEAVPASYP